MTLTSFLLARIAEDEAGNGCYGEGEYETCFRRTERIERECEAKRRIVRWCGPRVRVVDGVTDSSSATASFTLRCLALPYADHPDYDPDWRP